MNESEHAASVRLQLLAQNCEALLANLARVLAEKDALQKRLDELAPKEPGP